MPKTNTFRIQAALITMISVSVLAHPSVAQTAAPASLAAEVAPQTQQTGPEAFIQTLGNNAISVIADKSLSREQHEQKYTELLTQAVDLKTIGHFVVGRAWDSASPDQQAEFMRLFQIFVIQTYSNRLNFYSGESFMVKGGHPESDKDTIVNSVINHPSGQEPTKVDWRVRQADGKYLIVDVVVEGVSQSVTQRQEYSSIIQKDGGKLDSLIELLRQRVQPGQTSGDAAR